MNWIGHLLLKKNVFKRCLISLFLLLAKKGERMRTPYGVANLEKLSAVELVLRQQDVNCNQLYNFPMGDIP